MYRINQDLIPLSALTFNTDFVYLALSRNFLMQDFFLLLNNICILHKTNEDNDHSSLQHLQSNPNATKTSQFAKTKTNTWQESRNIFSFSFDKMALLQTLMDYAPSTAQASNPVQIEAEDPLCPSHVRISPETWRPWRFSMAGIVLHTYHP
jgi:hypothetical protein